MKRFLVIPVTLIVLILLSPGFQSTAFAASLNGSLAGQHGTIAVPNCPVSIKNSSVVPRCVSYPPCTKTGCYNVDPYNSGCAKAEAYNHISINSAPIIEDLGNRVVTVGYINNYYSSWCIANWATVNTGGHLWITTHDANGYNEKMCYPNNCKDDYFGPNYPTWTNMVDGTKVTVACTNVNDPAFADTCVSQ